MRAFNDGKAEKKKKNTYDDKYNNLKVCLMRRCITCTAKPPAQPSISIFGTDIAVDWTGQGGKGDGVAARARKNGISNDQQVINYFFGEPVIVNLSLVCA